MPTPPHHVTLLAALGDGGTVATCEAVCAAAGGIPGHVPAPTVEAVMAALGDTAARDTADRVVDVYTTALVIPGPAVEPVMAPESPQEPAGDDNAPEAPEADAPPAGDDSDPQNDDPHALQDAPPVVMDDDIDWDDVLPDETPAEAAPKPEPTAATIRAWAKTTGIPVPARGAIPYDVRAQYDAAH